MANYRDVELIERLMSQSRDAFREGDLERFIALVDDAAVVMWPNEHPFVGREAIRSWYSQNVFDQFDYLELVGSSREVEIAGDWAYVWAMAKGVVRSKTDGETFEFSSKAIDILRRQPDDSWKYWRLISNMSPITPGEQ